MLLERKRDGLPTPALDRRPALLPGLDFYLLAYDELIYDRPMGMTVGPIPWSSIDRWAVRNGVGNDEFNTLVNHIRAMENAVYLFEQRKQEGKR